MSYRLGREQLGGHVQGTNTWVGTREAAAVFRSFGIRARLVDFMGGHKSSGSRHCTSTTAWQPGV